jgi:hypothetical protein
MIRCFGQQFLDDTDPQAIWTWRGKGEYNKENFFVQYIMSIYDPFLQISKKVP